MSRSARPCTIFGVRGSREAWLLTVVGLGLSGGILLLALLGAVGGFPYDPGAIDLDAVLVPPAFWPAAWLPDSGGRAPDRAVPPSSPDDWDAVLSADRPGSEGHRPRWAHLLGTDGSGRDLLARLISGGLVYPVPTAVALLAAIGLGVLLGVLAGFTRGPWEAPANGLIRLLSSIPRLFLVLVAAALLGPQMISIGAILGLSTAPRLAQVLKSKLSSLAGEPFVEAARATGLSESRIVVRHLLLANCSGVILSRMAHLAADLLLFETSLAYLGFGVQEPHASWGNMVVEGGDRLFGGYPWLALLPAGAILITLLGFHLLGEGLDRLWGERR